MSLRDKIKEIIKKHLDETSATGTGSGFTAGSGANYATPFAFNPKKVLKVLNISTIINLVINQLIKKHLIKQLKVLK